MIDTHAHIDTDDFDADRADVIARAYQAGVSHIFLPAVDLPSVARIEALWRQYPRQLRPMIGLQPEEVRADWRDVLAQMHARLTAADVPWIAIGECGLDFYWSREYEAEQLAAFEEQVRWSCERRLPLMIHCRKAQAELTAILRRYEGRLAGGVFHCFTGNAHEAEELLRFDGFVLGVGGVSTFKSSHLRDDLPRACPLDRLVLETDSPYMAPTPHRGKRNEPAFVPHIAQTLAQAYGVTTDELTRHTDENTWRVFGQR